MTGGGGNVELCSPAGVKTLLSRYGFHFSKSLGQNFLIAPWVPREIAAASGAGPDTGVLEIGPGVGTLTVELARQAGRVVAVEVDRALLPILAETLEHCPNAAVIAGDILKLDLKALVAERFTGVAPLVCANLPYHITTPVLTRLLECRLFPCVTVMVQKEVAQRICARPGKGDYGAFSVFCQYYARTELLFDVPRECFLPAPKVTSAVLRLTAQPPPEWVHHEASFFRVVRGAFAQRRKTLLNALSSAFPLSKDELRRCMESAGISPGARGETLDLRDFARLADVIPQ